MMDRVLEITMNLTVVGLIAATAGGSLFLGYWGLVELFNGNAGVGGCAVFSSLAPAIGALKLARYKNDLVDQ